MDVAHATGGKLIRWPEKGWTFPKAFENVAGPLGLSLSLRYRNRSHILSIAVWAHLVVERSLCVPGTQSAATEGVQEILSFRQPHGCKKRFPTQAICAKLYLQIAARCSAIRAY